MRRYSLILLGLLILTAAGPINVDSSADDVLDALDARGKDLKTLSADVRMSDIDPTIGDVADIRIGKLYYEVSPNGDPRWRAVFDKKQIGHKIVDDKHEWAFAKGKLVDRDYRTQSQQTRQILKPGEKMQLFNLEGPFPLPLGQDKADVHKHFAVQKLPLDKDDPAGTVHLQLTPVAGTDLARQFKTIDLWVDPKTNMPVRITVLDGNQTSIKQTDLSNVNVTDPPKDSDFQLQPLGNMQGWNLTDE